MNIVDCHLHSSFSFDSKEPIENYVKKAVEYGDEYFITTEHADLESHIRNGEDLLSDVDLQQSVVQQLNAKYPVKVLLGIEIGWRESVHRRNLELVNSYPFDMVILSVHETEQYDVSTPQFSIGREIDDCYDEYLGCIIRAIDAFDNFDTFGHLDYVLRYIGHTDLSKHHSKLTEIFTKLIAKGKALEINTRMLNQPQGRKGIEYIISQYTSLGGRKFTLGSDSHSLDKFKSGFDDAVALLKKYGIENICFFVNRKEKNISI